MGWFQNLFARGRPAPITTAKTAKARLDVACPKPIVKAKMNKLGKMLVVSSEGCELKVYKCPSGRPTQGYGAIYGADGHRLTMDAKPITKQEALALFDRDIEHFSERVQRLVTVTVTDNQFSALVSLAYNIGAGALGRSKLLAKLNAGDYEGAAGEFWDFRNGRDKNGNKVILPGLVRRRALEKKIFLT